MSTIHYDVALAYAESLKTKSEIKNIKREDFLENLIKYAEQRGVQKITKLRVRDIDILLKYVCSSPISEHIYSA